MPNINNQSLSNRVNG